MLTNLQHYRIVLGSNSPRRKELLAGLDLKFEVEVIPGIDESYPDDLTADEIP
ncbi:MAG: septum formation inhibitor Maf, partial [Parabacteroides sp.]|nr:septum formation inhibitor Maf [Parabacteroides sp.]